MDGAHNFSILLFICYGYVAILLRRQKQTTRLKSLGRLHLAVLQNAAEKFVGPTNPDLDADAPPVKAERPNPPGTICHSFPFSGHIVVVSGGRPRGVATNLKQQQKFCTAKLFSPIHNRSSSHRESGKVGMGYVYF